MAGEPEMATTKKKSGKKAQHGPIDTVLAHIMAMLGNPKRMHLEANACRGALGKIKEPARKRFLTNLRDDILAAGDDKKEHDRLRKDLIKWMNKEGFHP